MNFVPISLVRSKKEVVSKENKTLIFNCISGEYCVFVDLLVSFITLPRHLLPTSVDGTY